MFSSNSCLKIFWFSLRRIKGMHVIAKYYFLKIAWACLYGLWVVSPLKACFRISCQPHPFPGLLRLELSGKECLLKRYLEQEHLRNVHLNLQVDLQSNLLNSGVRIKWPSAGVNVFAQCSHRISGMPTVVWATPTWRDRGSNTLA